ncbi:MAG TPA: putative lipoprotein [Candidatus Binatia bacterium]|nr:putative lipoprotein [Candidatus Binatia bacterium]
MIRARYAVAIAMLMAASMIGCSISTSSGSISTSISSPFQSSSASSPGKAAYQNEVADYTHAYVISGGQFDTFVKGLANVAERNGISNWEAEDVTYVGIGQGLAKAKFTQAQVDVFAKNASGGDERKAKLVQQGYDSAQ